MIHAHLPKWAELMNIPLETINFQQASWFHFVSLEKYVNTFDRMQIILSLFLQTALILVG